MSVFFTSDLHFSHKSLLESRSDIHKVLFPNVDHMNEWLVYNWNSQVNKRDLVWVLGDVSWTEEGLYHLSRCNGHKKLILGNHDKFSVEQYGKYFTKLYGVWKKYKIIMSHIPIHPQELEFRNWPCNIHGHIHHKDRCLGGKYINPTPSRCGR